MSPNIWPDDSHQEELMATGRGTGKKAKGTSDKMKSKGYVFRFAFGNTQPSLNDQKWLL